MGIFVSCIANTIWLNSDKGENKVTENWAKIHKKEGGHRCTLDSDCAECGPAITYCFENDDGSLWAGNGEYESQVNFCPICGRKVEEK